MKIPSVLKVLEVEAVVEEVELVVVQEEETLALEVVEEVQI
jgi:hypothetical protein